uniref:Elongation of very long chain fatty acids protein n=1 Tax=Lygus hesperus TaxID=30085 RepID=A0A0A9W4J9_LYGHE
MVLGIVRSAIDYHDYVMDTYGDPRVKDWLLMSGPLPTILLCLTYVFVVKYLGPKLMEKRKPFELRKTLIVYNASLVALSAWMVYEALTFGWFNGYSFKCQPCDFANSPNALRMARVVWWYYFSKFIEFLDTIFFVMRKKDNQISTLHVIHHAICHLAHGQGPNSIQEVI